MFNHLVATEDSKIHIKKENEGKFTQYCKDHGYTKVTNACIKEGLKDPDPTVRKEANFARNSRKWEHDKK